MFLTGLLSGSGLTYVFVRPAVSQSDRPQSGRPWHRPPDVEEVVKGFSRNLDLDPEQEKQVREILLRSREKYDAAYKRVRQKHHEIRQATLEEIRGILRPDQRQKLEDFVKKRDRQWREHRKKSDR